MWIFLWTIVVYPQLTSQVCICNLKCILPKRKLGATLLCNILEVVEVHHFSMLFLIPSSLHWHAQAMVETRICCLKYHSTRFWSASLHGGEGAGTSSAHEAEAAGWLEGLCVSTSKSLKLVPLEFTVLPLNLWERTYSATAQQSNCLSSSLCNLKYPSQLELGKSRGMTMPEIQAVCPLWNRSPGMTTVKHVQLGHGSSWFKPGMSSIKRACRKSQKSISVSTATYHQILSGKGKTDTFISTFTFQYIISSRDMGSTTISYCLPFMFPKDYQGMGIRSLKTI